jgi:DNA-binding XRE family transcriptional regulator
VKDWEDCSAITTGMQHEIAMIRVSGQYGIRHMEDGDVSPTLVFLLKVCGALEVDFSEIFRESNDV